MAYGHKKYKTEEHESEVIVVDILPYVLSVKRGEDKRGNPRKSSVIGVGTRRYTLLDIEPREDASIKIGEILNLGPENREKVKFVARKLRYEELPDAAKENLESAISKIVERREKEYINFINNSGMVTSAMHVLRLLPGVGPKVLQKILEEREKKPFESFKDFNSRVNVQAERLITKRIIEELSTKQRYYLFVKDVERSF
ncbi:MAG: DUF655 domain-containing protein [Candidatus Korarchaeota archaeon]